MLWAIFGMLGFACLGLGFWLGLRLWQDYQEQSLPPRPPWPRYPPPRPRPVPHPIVPEPSARQPRPQPRPVDPEPASDSEPKKPEPDHENENEHEHEHEPEDAGPRAELQIEPAHPTDDTALVAYGCPECGGNLDLTPETESITCSYCDVQVQVVRLGSEQDPTPRVTERQFTLGRFHGTILRQVVYRKARELIRWLPLDEHRCAFLCLRQVRRQESGAGPWFQWEPIADPETLEKMGIAAAESLRSRPKLGLAARQALHTLFLTGKAKDTDPLEIQIVLIDSAASSLTVYDGHGPPAWVYLPGERTVRSFERPGRKRLGPQLLTSGDQSVFRSEDTMQIGAGDVVVLASPAATDWVQSGGAHKLRELPSHDHPSLARFVFEEAWKHMDGEPKGDVLVVALEVIPAPRPDRASLRKAEVQQLAISDQWEVAWVGGDGTFGTATGTHPLHHAVACFAGLEDEGLGERLAARIAEGHDSSFVYREQDEAVDAALKMVTGEQPHYLAAYLGDKHGQVLIRCSSAPWQLPGRGMTVKGADFSTREPYTISVDASSRLLFPGALPMTKQGGGTLESLAQAWPGGKTSALWEACREHEEHASSAELLEEIVASAQLDQPEADFSGLVVLSRRVDI